ncbi:MAG: RyR domain-containing protein [Flavobacteriales bacterium]
MEDKSEEEIVNILGQVEHRRWCMEKLLDGWESLPETKKDEWYNNNDPFKNQKNHYCLRPFDTLPEDEKDKDHGQVKFVLNRYGDTDE